MTTRTSDSHPLYVDWLTQEFPGRLGMTLAPGTKDQSGRGPRWDRDVDKDIAALVEARPAAEVLVSLLEDRELERYQITSLRDAATARGLEHIEFSIPDLCAPTSIEAAAALVETIRARLRDGKNVVVHCRGGIGRTGTIVGCLLAAEGVEPDAAFALMQKARKERSMPETEVQRDFVRAFARSLRGRAARPGSPASAPASFDLIETLLAGDAAAIASAEEFIRAQPRSDGRALVSAAERAVQRDPAAIVFDETGYAILTVAGRRLSAGRFDVMTIAALRREQRRSGGGAATVSVLSGASPLTDIGTLQALAPGRTLFQVASQFNCLEAPGPSLSSVASYFSDSTQGPRASISAFPGTLLRHYAAPDGEGGRFTQTAGKQVELLAGALLADAGRVQSGYLMTQHVPDLAAAAALLEERFEDIAVGVHDGVQVVLGHDWNGGVPGAPRIAQVFTSSLALGYSHSADAGDGAALCRPLLRASYLGTLLAAAARGKARVVLTLIGGGVFGNPLPLIWDSIFWAADQAAAAGATLEVVVNAHAAGVLPEAARRCADRGGRVVSVR